MWAAVSWLLPLGRAPRELTPGSRRAYRCSARPDRGGFPRPVYAARRLCEHPIRRRACTSLSSAASRNRQATGRRRNILAGRRRESPGRPFHYHDKGIMAMIGRKAAVAEVGEHRHELHGRIAFAAWLGVHAAAPRGRRSGGEGIPRLGETTSYLRPRHRPGRRCSTSPRSTRPASTGAPADPSRLLGVHGVQPAGPCRQRVCRNQARSGLSVASDGNDPDCAYS